MNDNEIIDGLCEFYQGVDEVYSKCNNKDITPDQGVKKIAELLSKYYRYYLVGVYDT